MEYRMFGRTGVMVSPLALGTMNFGNPTPEDESIRIIQRAMDVPVAPALFHHFTERNPKGSG